MEHILTVIIRVTVTIIFNCFMARISFYRIWEQEALPSVMSEAMTLKTHQQNVNIMSSFFL